MVYWYNLTTNLGDGDGTKLLKKTCEETKIALKGAISDNHQPTHKVNKHIDGLVLLGPFSSIHMVCE